MVSDAVDPLDTAVDDALVPLSLESLPLEQPASHAIADSPPAARASLRVSMRPTGSSSLSILVLDSSPE